MRNDGSQYGTIKLYSQAYYGRFPEVKIKVGIIVREGEWKVNLIFS
jgi:hypothetical protein